MLKKIERQREIVAVFRYFGVRFVIVAFAFLRCSSASARFACASMSASSARFVAALRCRNCLNVSMMVSFVVMMKVFMGIDSTRVDMMG